MKISALVSAVVLGCGLFAQGAFAAEPAVAKSAVYEPAQGSAQVIKVAAPASCQGVSCFNNALPTTSCGAYVSSGARHGYGFDMGKAAAISKARAMCGLGESCKVVVAACEE